VKRPTADGSTRYRVRYRLGGRESATRYGGSFQTMREAKARRDWITGELAAMRVPDLRLLEHESPVTVREIAERWKASRVDVSAGTMQTYDVSLGRLLPRLGDMPVENVEPQTVAALVADLHAAGLRKQTIRKTVSVLGMVLDHGGVQPNPARDRVTVRMPREERRIVEPPTAEHVEAVDAAELRRDLSESGHGLTRQDIEAPLAASDLRLKRPTPAFRLGQELP